MQHSEDSGLGTIIISPLWSDYLNINRILVVIPIASYYTLKVYRRGTQPVRTSSACRCPRVAVAIAEAQALSMKPCFTL
jgi:hypothetical protein